MKKRVIRMNEKKIRVFISQPMKGKTDDEILSERAEASDYIMKMFNGNAEIIDSFFDDEPDTKTPAMFNLGRSLCLLADADVAYFIKGWEEARGCRIEHECASNYGGIDVIVEG